MQTANALNPSPPEGAIDTMRAQAMSKPTPTESLERPMRILVVDDLELNRDLLARRIQRLGHEAGIAVNGRDALDKLQQQDWDLVLLDITMPEMDGYETLRRIRADPLSAQLPVVMVSAIDETESVVRCLELGADDYLPKPFNPVVLQARIESSLAKKRLQDHKSHLLQALSRELQIGQRIQQGFLPTELPSPAGWSLGASCTPARQVGGDFYDAYSLPGGLLAFVIADVCDKGVGAALYMALFRTLLRAMACQATLEEPPPTTLMRSVAFANDYIATVHGRENMFATLFFALLEPDSGRMYYLNAGHEAPFFQHAEGGDTVRLDITGQAVGLLPGKRCSVQTLTMLPGSRLLLYTDGATEALGVSGPFGEEVLGHAFVRHVGSAQEMVDGVRTQLTAHVGAFEPHDDVTLLGLMRESAGS
ncbi:Response regulator receiver domain-containing protein [Polaromonas sp. OV174]|uniref:PP2C family protein-serine/threonine phosphatase n=1 Tax=Polaromonas sp. OV174 TaxID=1855300 RepID=UPI0008EDE419|nr:SpoIIE family protein phosphatase [Polaromonas sp. OV174]SFC24692.1 Response regulator receiver domain-containing protein [Polaromonas sp. OV174]